MKTKFADVKGMGEPARRALIAEGHAFVEDLVKTREKELAALHGVGSKALGILKEALKEKGLDFKKK